MRFRRRRSPREWADDDFVDDWLGVRNRKVPGRSSQERRRRWVIGMILMSLPLSLVGCLISSAASSSSDEALEAAVRAEAAAGSVELPTASHVAGARVARWAEESGIGPVAVAPASWRRVSHEACGDLAPPGGLAAASGPEVASDPEADYEPAPGCESHAFRVVPSTGDGSWELEATVLVNVPTGAASGVYVKFSQPPASQSLLATGRPQAVPERLEELLETWARAWVANDTAELADLANDATGELVLPPSGAPEGWVLDEEQGVRVLEMAGSDNPFSVLVEFRVIPPAKLGANVQTDSYDALVSQLTGAGEEDYGDLLSLLAEYAQEPSVPVTAEVSVLVEGSLARIVGWGPVGSPSGRIGAE